MSSQPGKSGAYELPQAPGPLASALGSTGGTPMAVSGHLSVNLVVWP